MDRRLLVLAFTLVSTPATATFCTVDQWGNGPQCFYVDLNSCQQAARTRRGACVVQQQQQLSVPAPAPVASQPGVYNFQQNTRSASGAFMDGYERGRKLKMAQEQHDAQMRLLAAQEAAARAPARAPIVTYACQRDAATNSWYETRTPAVGCVVIAVE